MRSTFPVGAFLIFIMTGQTGFILIFRLTRIMTTHFLCSKDDIGSYFTATQMFVTLTMTGLTGRGAWVPRIIHRVDQIPVLGTGKLDLKRCLERALEAVAD